MATWESWARSGVSGEAGWKPSSRRLPKVFAAVEQAFEGDGAGGGAVVEEDGDAAAFVELDEVGMGGVDGGVGRWTMPVVGVVAGGGFVESAQRERADAGALVGREDGELDAFARPSGRARRG